MPPGHKRTVHVCGGDIGLVQDNHQRLWTVAANLRCGEKRIKLISESIPKKLRSQDDPELENASWNFALLAHQLTPEAATISAFAQLFAQSGAENLTERQLRYLAAIGKSADRIASMLGNSRSLLEDSYSPHASNLKSNDIVELLKDVIDQENRKHSVHDRQRIKLKVGSTIPIVQIDEVGFRRALSGLLARSTGWPVSDAKVDVAVLDNGHSIIVEMTFINFAEEIRDVGEIDRNQDPMWVRSQPIHGAGLTYANRLIADHGGTLSVTALPVNSGPADDKERQRIRTSILLTIPT